MREIKFRAWDKISEQYVDTYIMKYDYSKSLGDSIPNYTFQQFTGLKDKNKKEIYEGDVVTRQLPAAIYGEHVSNYPIRAEVIFEHGGFSAKPNQNKDSIGTFGIGEDCEIIGNIWENPELISKEV